MVERKFEGIAHVIADHGRRPAEGGDKTDPDRIRGSRGVSQGNSRCAREPK
jgi:hypothetical protein